MTMMMIIIIFNVHGALLISAQAPQRTLGTWMA